MKSRAYKFWWGDSDSACLGSNPSPPTTSFSESDQEVGQEIEDSVALCPFGSLLWKPLIPIVRY
jgi:hypothetical protein